MKPNTSESVLTVGVAEREIDMGLDLDSLPFIMQQLTDLYSDPILACVREYSTNAKDSHSFAGTTRPVEVTLPTADNLNFTVQDWGVGMDEDDLAEVYSKFGASTGRGTNKVTGMLGFGSKAAMTYGSSFRVESSKDGVTRQVVVTKDADDIPKVKIMASIDTGKPNGVTITIPVQKYDIGAWAERADNFYKFWRTPVLVNGKAPKKFYEIDDDYVQVEDDIWVHLSERSYVDQTVSYFVQGGVPYPLEMKDYSNHSVRASDVFVCYVETGLLDFTPSREALMHTDRTNDLIEVARGCARESMKRHIAKIGASMSTFEKFKLGFKLPPGYNALDSLDLKRRHYAADDSAWHLSTYGNTERINKALYGGRDNYLQREFTSNTLEKAKGSDGQYRFVLNFSFKTVTKRHIASLKAHIGAWFSDQEAYADWPKQPIVFLPASANFDTDSFPGIDWRDVELLKVKRSAPKVTTPHIYEVHKGGDISHVETFDEPIVIFNSHLPYSVVSFWPDIAFVKMPEGKTKKADKARTALKADNEYTMYHKWKDAKIKEMVRGLDIHDRRWVCAPTDLRSIYNMFGRYSDCITNPTWRKLQIKPPSNEDLIEGIGVLYDRYRMSELFRDEEKLSAQTRQRVNDLLEAFPLIKQRTYNRDHPEELVTYINAKGRQRKPIEPNEDFVKVDVN